MVKWCCAVSILLMSYCGFSIASSSPVPSAGTPSEVSFSVVIKSERRDNNYLRGFAIQYAGDGDTSLGSLAITDAPPSVIPLSERGIRIQNYNLGYYVDGPAKYRANYNATDQMWRDRHVVWADEVIGFSNSPNGKQVALAVRNRKTDDDSILIVDEETSKVVAKESFDKREVGDLCWSHDSLTVAAVVSKSRTGISPFALLLAFSGHPVAYKDFSVGVLSVSSGKWTESEPLARDVDAGASYMRCNGVVEQSPTQKPTPPALSTTP